MKIKTEQTKKTNNYIFTDEEVTAITELIEALRAVVDDVLDQGYTITDDGKLEPPQQIPPDFINT